jgi:outer membrane protein OmpA-like peptidoglycan-associated protein
MKKKIFVVLGLVGVLFARTGVFAEETTVTMFEGTQDSFFLDFLAVKSEIEELKVLVADLKSNVENKKRELSYLKSTTEKTRNELIAVNKEIESTLRYQLEATRELEMIQLAKLEAQKELEMILTAKANAKAEFDQMKLASVNVSKDVEKSVAARNEALAARDEAVIARDEAFTARDEALASRAVALAELEKIKHATADASKELNRIVSAKNSAAQEVSQFKTQLSLLKEQARESPKKAPQKLQPSVIAEPAKKPGGALTNVGKNLLNTIYFGPDQTNIIDMQTLSMVGNKMQANPEMEITVRGYSAAAGTVNGQMRVSEERARNCAEFLMINYGIDSERIKIEWVGASERPRTAGDESAMSACRAVEVIV